MKISSFCLITNPQKFGYPYLESIKSFADISDEVLVIDGGTDEDILEKINKIEKVRIIRDTDLDWEENWSYWRMAYNVNRGLIECKGDIVLNFGVDWIFDKNDKTKFFEDVKECIKQNKLVLTFCRKNFILTDSYFDKSYKTLAINRIACNNRGIKPVFGIDNKRWSWGIEPIVSNYHENCLEFGTLLNTRGNSYITKASIFNYSFTFSTIEQCEWVRFRHEKAINRQFRYEYKGIKQPTSRNVDSKDVLNKHIKDCINYYNNKEQKYLDITDHPEIIKNKIINLKKNQRGYNCWDNLNKSGYYN